MNRKLITWYAEAYKDYLEYERTNHKLFERINRIIKDLLRNNVSIGKAELLSGNLKGYRAIRLTQEHRLIYELTETSVIILSCKYHYSNLPNI